LEPDLVFDSPVNGGAECDLVVLPDSPRSLAICLFGGGTPAPVGVWIFDDVVPRPVSVPGGYGGVIQLEPGRTPRELFAFDEFAQTDRRVRRLLVSSQGVSLDTAHGGLINGAAFQISAAGTNILLGGGQLHDAVSLAQRGVLPSPFSPQAIGFSVRGDRAVVAAGSFRGDRPLYFAGFRTDTLSLIGTTRAAVPAAVVQSVILWEPDRLAALADGWLVLGRLDLAGPPPLDSDADGIPDRWEVEHGLDPLRQDSRADPDLDGASNFDEYLFGTDPQSHDSVPSVEAHLIGPNLLRLVFSCANDRGFQVQRSTNPGSDSWSTIRESISSGGLQFQDIPTSESSNAFFRIRLIP